MSVVRTTVNDSRYSIISPIICDPITNIHITKDLAEWEGWTSSDEVQSSDIVAFDTETNGTNLHAPDFKCVGIGISIGTDSLYLCTKDKTKEEIRLAFEAIRNLPLIAHNLYFDSKVVSHYVGTVRGDEYHAGAGWLNYQFCTFGLSMQLSNEDFEGQQHGLKWLEKNVLGWQETNEVEKNEWLVANGFITAKSRLAKLDTPEKRLKAYEERDKKGRRKLSPDQSQMWRCPTDILGKYCALDSLACWQLFKYVFEPAFDKIPHNYFIDWHQIDFLTLVRIHVDAYFHGGIKINVPKLSKYSQYLTSVIKRKEIEVRNHPKVKPFIDKYEETLYEEYISNAPNKFNKWEKKSEPPKRKKNGKISKVWVKWNYRYKWLDTGPTLSKAFVKWNQTRRKILRGEDPSFKFNFGSPDQLKLLIYEHNFKYEIIREHTEEKPGRIKLLHNGLELDLTNKGGLPTGKQALKAIGDFCDLIDELSMLRGQLQFCTAYINRASLDPDGMVYPDVRIPGTTTGRVSGGDDKESKSKNTYKFNSVNPPKVKGILECWLPREGYSLWDYDVAGLESVVVTEISRDGGMMNVWGPEAKPNDMYIYVSSLLGGDLGKPFLDEGYDPYNPDMKLIKVLKNKYKKQRTIGKTLVLSGTYMAGAFKQWTTLRLQKVDVLLEEVKGWNAKFWELFKGIKDLERELQIELKDKGWALNGTGRPMCASERKLKDACNLVVQSCGHDCLMKGLRILYSMVEANGWGPDKFYWFLPDMHDQMTFATKGLPDDVVINMQKESTRVLNEELGGLIPLKFEGGKIASFWEAKE